MRLCERVFGDDIRIIPVNIDRNEVFDAVESTIIEAGFSMMDAFSWNYNQNGEIEIEFYEGSMIVEIYLECYKGKYTIESRIRKFPGR